LIAAEVRADTSSTPWPICRKSQDVPVTASEVDRCLTLLQGFQAAEDVPELGRPLEVESFSGLPHLALDLSPEAARPSGEDLQDPLDHFAVFGLCLPPHAWGPAPIDEVIETRSVRGIARKIVMAASHGKHVPNHPQGAPHGPDVRERTEVARSVPYEAPGHQDPRKRLVHGHLDVRKRLVVPELDVELRCVLLDEVRLEKKGLCR
jgi:hypothetical protein